MTEHQSNQEPFSVIIPIVAGIGNALLAVPMVRQLKKHRPQSRLTIVAQNQAMAEVFRRLDEVERVLILDRSLPDQVKTIGTIRRWRADVCLIPFPSNRWQYSLFALLSGARRRILHSYPAGRFRTLAFLPAERVPAVVGLHDVVQNLKLLEQLGIKPDIDEGPVFPLNDQDRQRAAKLLDRAGFDRETHPVVVHAGSARTAVAQAKRWPVENYGRLVQALQSRFDRQVVIIEGPDEPGIGREIITRVSPPPPPVIALLGNLGDSAALLKRARLYVGSDSGLAHLAAAVGTPAVTLFGPTDPQRVCPYGQRRLVVEPTGTPCAPCYAYPWRSSQPRIACREPICMKQITVEAVMAKVLEAAQPNETTKQRS